MRRLLTFALGLTLLLLLAFEVALRAVPLPERLFEDGSQVVLYRDGETAHVFLAPDDRWRIPVQAHEVDPAFVEALLHFEDRRFHRHPGVDPLAVARAAFTNLSTGRRVSGASTLTMQLVRMVEPRPRTLRAKVVEVFRAVQLERHLSKEQILSAYLTFAPYGRNVEGIQAAALSTFGHGADALTPAQIATLLAIPQSPTRRTPSPANARRLQAARDHVAAHLVAGGALTQDGLDEQALLAQIRAMPAPDRMLPFPREAPHAATWLRARHPDQARIHSTLDRGVQRQVERAVTSARPWAAQRGIDHAAAVVMDHRTGEVLGTVGSFDFWAQAPGAQIPGFAVPRSPGSALKPFLYALAIEEGLALPEQLVQDVPLRFGGYAPRNFDDRFDGVVRLEDALSRSLNLPFIALLRDLGVERFHGWLQEAGVDSLHPDPAHYGLTLAAGGIELTPLEVAGLYAALAADGAFREPRLLQAEQAPADALLSPGASWLTRRALALRDRPDFPARSTISSIPRHLHWKTGTSFGHRDAWSAGSDRRHTAVVWMGNFDQRPSRALVGAEATAPLLFDLLEGLGDGADARRDDPPPADLVYVAACPLSGHRPTAACGAPVEVLARASAVPTEPCPFHVQVEVDVDTGRRVLPGCRAGRSTEARAYVIWPAGVRHWLADRHRRQAAPPPLDPACRAVASGGAPEIAHPAMGQVALLIPGLPAERQHVALEAHAPTPDARLSWFVNGAFLGTAPADERLWWQPVPGVHEVAVVDEAGQMARRTFEVRRP